MPVNVHWLCNWLILWTVGFQPTTKMSGNTCEDCKSTENDVVQRQGDKMLCVACNDKLPIESDSTEDIPNKASAPAAVEPDDTVVVSQETSDIPGSEVPIAECCTPSCSYGGRRSGRQILVRCSWCMRFFHKRCLSLIIRIRQFTPAWTAGVCLVSLLTSWQQLPSFPSLLPI